MPGQGLVDQLAAGVVREQLLVEVIAGERDRQHSVRDCQRRRVLEHRAQQRLLGHDLTHRQLPSLGESAFIVPRAARLLDPIRLRLARRRTRSRARTRGRRPGDEETLLHPAGTGSGARTGRSPRRPAQSREGLLHLGQQRVHGLRLGPARGPHRRDLELHPGIRRAAHLTIGLEERAQEVDQLVRRRGRAGGLERLGLVRGEIGEHPGWADLEDEQPPHGLDHLAAEQREILAGLRGAVDGLERGGPIAAEQRRHERADMDGRGGAEEPGHSRLVEPPLAVGDGGIEQRERVAQAALRGAHQHGQRRSLEGHLLLRQDLRQARGEQLGRNGLEVEALAAREHGGGNPLGLGGREDEDHVGRRLFQRLEKGVEGRAGEHVDLVDDVDLEPAAGGSVLDVLPERPDVVDTRVGGRVDLQDVHRSAGDEILAGGTGAAGLGAGARGAAQGLGQEAGGGGLPDPARSREEVGVRHAPRDEGVLERSRDRLLPDHGIERRGPPLPGQHLVRHGIMAGSVSARPPAGRAGAATANIMTVHPQSSRPSRERRAKPAPARYSHGTREERRTVAPFRAWRGLTHPVAWGPTINAVARGSFDTSDPREGIQPRYSGLRATGHRYLPV